MDDLKVAARGFVVLRRMLDVVTCFPVVTGFLVTQIHGSSTLFVYRLASRRRFNSPRSG